MPLTDLEKANFRKHTHSSDQIIDSTTEEPIETGGGVEGIEDVPGLQAALDAKRNLVARAARAVRSSNQVVDSGQWRALQFTGTDTFDTHSIHDPSTNNGTRFVLNQLGLWRVTLHANFAQQAGGDRYLVGFKNGAQYGSVQRQQGNSGIGNFLMWVDIVEATVITDYIECMVHQDSGSDVNTLGVGVVEYLGTVA